MGEAAKRMGLANATSARRSLQNAGLPLVVISARSFAVEESALATYMAQRAAAGGFAPGRPGGIHTKKKKKEVPG